MWCEATAHATAATQHFYVSQELSCLPRLQALCTEASLASLRRHYPQIYDADDKLLIDPGRVSDGRGRADDRRRRHMHL